MKLCFNNFDIGDKLKSSYLKFYYTGISTLILGVLIIGLWKPLYDWLVSENLILKDDSEVYESWLSTEKVPIYMSVYLFNWTNPESTLNKHEKPQVAELGPYVFRLREIKTNIKWNHNDTISFHYQRRFDFVPKMSKGSEDDEVTTINPVAIVSKTTISFHYQRRFDFVPKMSKGSEDDEVTTINPVAISLANYFRNTPKPAKNAIEFLMDAVEKSLYETKTAKTWIFEGYNDKILLLAENLRKVMPKLRFPHRFAWYYGKNMSEFYEINMYTGESDVNYEGLMHSMNYKTGCEMYFNQCDRIRGSLGSLWPQDTTKQNETYYFFPDMCGTFRLKKSGPETVYDIDGVRFEGDLDTFDNGLKFERNKCFQRNSTSIFDSGIRELSKLFRAPIFTSFPHFYAADESFRNAVGGLKPNSKKHQLYIIFEKDFSVVLDARFRLQLNVHIEPIEGFPSLKNMPSLFIPVAWFEIRPKFTQDFIDDLKLIFNTVPYLLLGCGIAFATLGCTLLISGLFLQRKNMNSAKYETTR